MRQTGKSAQEANINAAKTISDIIKTTLGPKGMDKLMVDDSGKIIITNDGVTILENWQVTHPAGKIIAETSRSQEDEIGDGTTTVAMLIGKLLENAEFLINKNIHPTLIVRGYELANEFCKKELEKLSQTATDEHLQQIAITSMTGKSAEGKKEELAKLAVKAAKSGNKDNILVLTSLGEKSELVDGLILDKEIPHDGMPKQLENAKIALLDMDLKIKEMEANVHVNISNPTERTEFYETEKKQLNKMAEDLINSGAKVILTNAGADELILNKLANAGILCLRRVPKTDLDILSRTLQISLCSSIEEIKDNLGIVQVKQEKTKEANYLYLSGLSDFTTIMLRANTKQSLDELKRAFTDALGDVLATLKDTKIVAGGGAIEIELSKRLKNYSTTLNGREQLAVEKFAESLEFIPETLAENAGMDSINTITELKSVHEKPQSENQGINLFENKITDTLKQGIIEPHQLKLKAIGSATEVANMILRIDDVLILKNETSNQSQIE